MASALAGEKARMKRNFHPLHSNSLKVFFFAVNNLAGLICLSSKPMSSSEPMMELADRHKRPLTYGRKF